MNDNPQDRPALGRLLMPVVLLHVVCCGGLLLVVLFGSAVLGSIGSWLGDPLVQGAALLLALAAVMVLVRRTWRKRRHRSSVHGAPGSVPVHTKTR